MPKGDDGVMFNAETRNRPLRAPTTHGEVGRPSERECREIFRAAFGRGSGGVCS